MIPRGFQVACDLLFAIVRMRIRQARPFSRRRASLVLKLVVIIVLSCLWFTGLFGLYYASRTSSWVFSFAAIPAIAMGEEMYSFTEPRFVLKERLFVWGARLTHQRNDHESGMKAQSEIYFDMFLLSGLAIPKFARFNSSFSNASRLLDDADLESALSVSITSINSLSCNVPCSLHLPQNVDSNAARDHRMIRCFLPTTVTPFLALSKSSWNKLHVSYKAHPDENESWQFNDRLIFNLDSESGAVGLAGPLHEPGFPAFHEQPTSRMTLCVGGVDVNGIQFLPEFIQYHLRIGVDRFVIGLHREKKKSDPLVKAEVAAIRSLLGALIESGHIVLQPMPVSTLQFASIERDTIKVLFYDTCLFHAKTIAAKYVGIWDMDEYIVQTPKIAQNLPDALDRLISPAEDCPDWCFISFPSHSIWQQLETRVPKKDIRNVADVFQIRQSAANMSYVWKKSVAKVKNAFNAGFHTFGSCLRNGRPRSYHRIGPNKHGPTPKDACAVHMADFATMHHYLGLFYGGHDHSKSFLPPFQPDEYSQFIQQEGFTIQVKDVQHQNLFQYNRVMTKREPFVG